MPSFEYVYLETTDHSVVMGEMTLLTSLKGLIVDVQMIRIDLFRDQAFVTLSCILVLYQPPSQAQTS